MYYNNGAFSRYSTIRRNEDPFIIDEDMLQNHSPLAIFVHRNECLNRTKSTEFIYYSMYLQMSARIIGDTVTTKNPLQRLTLAYVSQYR